MKTKNQSLFEKNFTLVVIGQIISLFGNAILRFALPLYLLRETGSSILFGAVNATSFIPMILFSMMGGVLADRLNKRNIMVVLDFSTAGLILIFYIFLGKVPIVPLMIVCLMVLYGISGTYQPTVQASIPILLKQEQITQGNAIINMVNTLASLLGPIIGGILFGTWGIALILFISIICFIFSAIMELFIYIPYQKRETKASIISIIKGDLKESWQYIQHEKPAFLSVIIVLALFNLVLSAAMIVGIPIMVVNILGMNDTELGITQGALGLGGLAGGMLVGILGNRLKLKQGYWILVVCSLTTACMGIALFPQIPQFIAYLLITVMSFIAMAVSAMFSIQMCSAIQKQTPSHLIGKIMALVLTIANCASPLGQALYGILFEEYKTMPWIVLFGAAVISLMISLYSKNIFKQLEQENR